jgi:Spy/CpxP family protein refolding chaperone
LVLAGALGVACAESTPQGGTTPTAEGAEGIPAGSTAEVEQGAEADELRAFHRHHHVGFIGFAMLSIPSLGLPPAEQANVERIRQDIRAKLQPQHDAMGALINAIADGVAAGNIDTSKTDPLAAKLAEVSTQMDDVTNDALNQLHAALTPPERQALALKVQAHYMVWERANADEQAHPDQEQATGQIQHLAQELGLSADQIAKADQAFTAAMAAAVQQKKFDAQAAEAHLQAFVDRFSSDQFDAKTLTTADAANAGLTSWGASRMVKMYQVITPILTPDQRTKLAAKLRERAAKMETATQ